MYEIYETCFASPQDQSGSGGEIRALGYTLSQAKRAGIDLMGTGFGSSNYRVLTYGKPDELRLLPVRYSELAPFLPLQVAVFAERNESLLVALNPLYLKEFFKQPELADIFARWNRDLQQILENVRDAPQK